jgi:predicted AAA+ superfamily ATPase
MTWIDRQFSLELQSIARTFPAVVLLGPRQVGKTSLLERIFADFNYVSLDVAQNAETAETRPDDFLRRYPPPVVLDEIQYAPAFFKRIKTFIDDNKGRNGLFILTGSQSFALMQSVADSLAGRAAVIPFHSLSGEEWRACPEVSRDLEWKDFLWQGGYPALWAGGAESPSRNRWYQGYLATYLERDVRNILNVGSLRDFERFLRACASRCAQMLNMSDIARDVGISPNTAKQWISVLSASGLIHLLEPYHRSLGKRIVKSPKLYFQDSGLAAYLMGFSSSESLWTSASAGALFENFVVGQWIRKRDWFEPSSALWYWRNQTGHEVDLLIERDGRLTAIECKLTEHPSNRDLTGIRKLTDFYGKDMIAHSYVACTTSSAFEIDQGVTAQSGFTTFGAVP